MTEDGVADRLQRIAARLSEHRLPLDAGLAFRTGSESVDVLIDRAGDALAPVSAD